MKSEIIAKTVSPAEVMARLRPGMSIFIGTGAAEPRTLTKALLSSTHNNLTDLELIQLVSIGDALAFQTRARPGQFRLKTFYSGWPAGEAITSGAVDLIPSRISRIPALIESGAIRVDAAFIQISPFDEAGFASLGLAVDVAGYAMEKASLVVGEINASVPRTMGNTFVHAREFDLFVNASEPLIYLPRPPVDAVLERVAAQVAAVIADGACLSFYPGALFEALAKKLTSKRDLGVHTFFFTDALMDLVECGTVTNRRKGYFRDKSLTSYALGTRELMKWLHDNPRVEFQGIDIVSDHFRISLNDGMVAILPARKIDLTGNVVLHAGRGSVGGPGQAEEFFSGALHSRGGRAVFALPSRNRSGESNILISAGAYPHLFSNREALDLIVTEYGIASLNGRTVRERAQALIDIAHPADRPELVRQARENHILFPDQIYLSASGAMYPYDIAADYTLKDGRRLHFRAIKPSDEEEMRRLFYRFSDRTIYYRYFSELKAMPHEKMQEYVNIDYRRTMSLVGIVEEGGIQRIVAEGRYVRREDDSYGDTAFVVEESYQGSGIASFLLQTLITVARRKGLRGFTADVLADNKAIIKVFEKTGLPIEAVMEYGVYHLRIPFPATVVPSAYRPTLKEFN
ncbi:MAG TPA: GNAT family N-acetyltransferase [Syntrophales bacterium]|mgnify:FL=1|jgi:acyl-CoA hydrolase/predicted GNAT family acetyltransferase|nr:GNAT family N-acetyltransferase [Syntrophales bacterium]